MKRNPLQKFIPFRLALVVASLVAAWPRQARSQTLYWDNTGGTANDWASVQNWSTVAGGGSDPGAVPGASEIAEFSATSVTSAQTVNLILDRSVLSLTFSSAQAHTLLGGGTNRTLTLANGMTKSSTGAVTIGSGTAGQQVAIALGADQTWANNNNTGVITITNGVTSNAAGPRIFTLGGTATTAANIINGVIGNGSGTLSISKTGTATWYLNAANTYTGNVTVSDGVLQLRNATAGGAVGNSVLVTNSGAPAANDNNTLQVSGGITVNKPLMLENLGNGAARVSLEAASTVNANANTWSGPITIKGSTNQALNANTAPLIVTGNVTMDASPSTSLFIRGSNTGTMTGTFNLGQSCTLFKTDPGTWQINSTGNITGPVGCADGLLILNSNNALEPDSTVSMGQGSATTGRMQINAGFTQELTGISTPTGSTSPTGHTIFGPGSIDFGAPVRTITVQDNTVTLNDLTINAPILATNGFIKAGPGNLIMNGTVNGPVTVNAGAFSGTTTLPFGVTVNSGGRLGAGPGNAAGTLTSAGIVLGPSSGLAVNVGSVGSDFIASTGAVTTSGSAVIGVIPNGTFTTGQDFQILGYTGVSPGAGAFTVAGALGAMGSRATASVVDFGTAIGIHIDSADRTVWTGGASNSWDITGSANWKLASDNSATTYQQYDAVVFDDTGANPAIAITGALTPAHAEFANTTAKPYSITGPGSMGGVMVLGKTGNGTVTLTATNNYTGPTNVSGGLLIANFNSGTAVTPIPVLSPVNVTGPGTLRFISDNVATNVAHVISGNGTVEHNARNVAGAVTALSSTLTGANAGFTGTLRLLSPPSGTQRLSQVNASAVGSASIEVQPGHQFYTAASQVYNNAITIAGTGYQDANGFIGALRLDPGAEWAGPVTVAAGGGRIGAHSTSITNAGIVSGNISGGPLEVNVSNYNVSYTVIFSGTNSYTTTTVGGVGGVTPQNIASVSMRLNIGDGGTTGTLGTGAVTIAGDTIGTTNGTNGVLGFDRSDGYTLAPGNTITGAGSSLARVFLDLDCTGTGFNNNGVAIDLGTAGGAAGNIRAGVSRTNTVATLSGNVETGAFIIGSHNGTIPSTGASVTLASGANVATTSVSLATGGGTATTGNTNGASLTVAAGATLTATGQIFLGEGTSSAATVTQNGNVTLVTQLRAGHYPTELSTYNMNGGALLITGASPLNTPSTPTSGLANTTGDNNLNALPTVTTLGGGIYLGIDGTGVLNHTGGSVTTNWIVLDNRGDSPTGGDGIDRYNISGSALLKLRSEWGLIARNTSTNVSLGGGTIQLDNTGTGGPAGNTGPDLDVPLDAILNTVAATTTTLDTNGADNSFILTKNITGTGLLDLTGGGTINFKSAAPQSISASLAGSTAILKSDAGTTTLTANSSSYSGTATVGAGKLQVDGNLGGSVLVQSAATLGGGGTVGHVTAQSGGIVSPGASVGTLSAASLNLQAGSRYDVEITGAATSDKVNVAGALTANGTIKVTLSGYVPVLNDTFDIADAASFAGIPVFDFTAAALTAGLGWDTSQFSTNGTIKVTVPTDPFDAWATSFGLTGGKGGDDDNDGANNLLEFATNSDPKNNGAGARTYGKLQALSGNNVLTLTIAVRKSAVFAASGSKQTATRDKVIYTVEGSDDLLLWNAVVISELNPADSAAVQASLSLPALGADWEWHSFRTDDNATLDPRDMIRLSVAAQP